MKKFKYKLEPLLRYRAFQEQQKKLEVAAARQDVVACEQRIEHMKNTTKTTRETLETAMAGGLDATRFRWYHDYLNGLSHQRVSEQSRREGLVNTLTRRQQELAEKSKAKKVVEKLKERKKEEYYKAGLKTEQQELDDMMILRNTRDE